LWRQCGAEGRESTQFLLVPLALLIGIVLLRRMRNRPPGYVLGAVTAAFGVLVASQGWATMAWTETRPIGIGDPDGELVLAMVASLSGMATIGVGVSIAALRWAGYGRGGQSQRKNTAATARLIRRPGGFRHTRDIPPISKVLCPNGRPARRADE